MEGFELKHNRQITKGSVENGVISISLFQQEGTVHLRFGGLDVNLKQHLTWFESTVEEGDDISIKAVNIEASSPIIKVIPEKEETLEDKIDEYNRLKRYLEKEGII